jgi:NADH-quinone oxidoreductase subunit J
MDFLVANFEAILFYTVAVLAVAGAVGVVMLKHPVHAAVALLETFVMVAVLFVLRHAEFLAAVQVLVYGGGIMVLYLFAIMLVRFKGLRPDEVFLSGLAPLAIVAGVILGALVSVGILLGTMAAGDGDAAALQTVGGELAGNTEAVGWILYTKYLVPFEVVSVLLLVAMIGAIIFGRRETRMPTPGEGVEP